MGSTTMTMTTRYPHEHLIQWAVQHGGFFHNDIEVVLTAEKGFHIIVRRDTAIPAETLVASCPMPCTLSVLNTMDTEGDFTCRDVKFPPAFLDEQPRETLERFYLMEQYLLGEKSWWGLYIATLPTVEEVKDWTFEEENDLQWIRGTNLETAMKKLTEKWKEHYEEGMEHLIKLGWRNAMERKLTWEIFKWASTIFTSRSFTSSVLTDTLPADRARFGSLSQSTTTEFCASSFEQGNKYEKLATFFSDGFPVLLPVLDILNYRPRAKVEWQARSTLVGLEVLETVEAGQEVCNNYGPRDNEALLLGYFFTIQDNPFDHYSVAIRVPPNSPLSELRSMQKVDLNPQSRPAEQKEIELKCYIFNSDHPRAMDAAYRETTLFSFDLLDSLSVLSGNDRELQEMYNFRKTLMKKGHFEDCRNILATLSQLLRECMARSGVLRKTRPGPEMKPSNQKQRFAQIYRDSQCSILRIAVLATEFVLRRSNGQGEDEEILQKIGEKYNLEMTVRLQLENIIHRHNPMTRPGELFNIEQLLKDLPIDLAARIHTTTAKLNEARKLKNNPKSLQEGLNEVLPTKSHYVIILSTMLSESKRGKLSARQKSWLSKLTQWYPPDDPNWSSVPEKQPTTPEDAPPPMLVELLDTARISDGGVRERWLEPEMLCWAWNVMEEELVNVPAYITIQEDKTKRVSRKTKHESSALASTEDMTILIYFPQVEVRNSWRHPT